MLVKWGRKEKKPLKCYAKVVSGVKRLYHYMCIYRHIIK